MEHKHIVKLIESFEDKANIYMILEYAKNGSLFNEIRRHGVLPIDKVKKYFREACLAIQFLH